MTTNPLLQIKGFSKHYQKNSTKTRLNLLEMTIVRTYGIFNNNIGLEKNLLDIKNPESKKQVSKFKLSNQNLLILLSHPKGND